MASPVKIISAINTFPAFFMIYVAVSLPVLSFAFGAAEAGDTAIAIPLGIFCVILMPFSILVDWITLPVCMVCSSLFWWLVFWKFNWLVIEAQVDGKPDQEQTTNP